MIKSSAVAIVAARSGGHILPGITLAKTMYDENPTIPLVFFLSKNKLDEHIASQSTIPATHFFIKLDNIAYKNPFKLLMFFYHAIVAFIQSLLILKRHRVAQVISMGGYLSIPVCLAAKLLRIPIELYELNVTPGKAVKFLSKIARQIHICFQETSAYLSTNNLVVSPYPLKYQETDKVPVHQAKQIIGLSEQKKTVLICGGSQGSIFINKTIKQWLEFNPHLHSTIQIIHQTGSHDKTDWIAFYKSHNIKAITFVYHNDMHLYYNAADVIISRAGAGSLFEVAFFEKPCVVIPLETRATDHQKYNAYAMAHHYAHLFTVLHEGHIKKNNTLLFSAISKHLMQTTNFKSNESLSLL